MRKRPRRIIPSMPASPSVQRLNLRAKRHRLNRANRVSVADILALIDSIKDVANRRQWPADLLSHYGTMLSKIANRMRYIERLNARRAIRLNVIQWQLDAGARLARTRDLNEELAWLLNRQHRNRNLYAMAQGKRTLAKLGVEHYRRIGKLGAQVRWDRERALNRAADSPLSTGGPATIGERGDLE